jgi:hypothetical protein
MKITRPSQTLLGVACAVVAFATGHTALAQSGGGFRLVGNNSSGGGTCAGGGSPAHTQFTVACSAGQINAGASLGGPYALHGGTLAAFFKPSGPRLTVTPSFGAVVVSWPASPAGFHLEASATVDGPWLDFGPGSPSGSDRFVAVGLSAPHNFFQLKKACAGGCPQVCPE